MTSSWDMLSPEHHTEQWQLYKHLLYIKIKRLKSWPASICPYDGSDLGREVSLEEEEVQIRVSADQSHQLTPKVGLEDREKWLCWRCPHFKLIESLEPTCETTMVEDDEYVQYNINNHNQYWNHWNTKILENSARCRRCNDNAQWSKICWCAIANLHCPS